MKSLILHFLLLILEVAFNLAPDAIYKYSRFFEVLLEKNFELVLDKGTGMSCFSNILYYYHSRLSLLHKNKSAKGICLSPLTLVILKQFLYY